MSERGAVPARVGVRELRQNLSVYLQRVQEGATFEVTEHGHPIARLTPRPPDTPTPLERLLAEGRATPARADLLELGPPIDLPGGGPSATDELLRIREEDRA